jgi:hypothetical protein
MPTAEVFTDILFMVLCYAYVLLLILVSGKMDKHLQMSKKTSRRFLHIMIGNLPFVIPFFTLTFFPALVAAPFILVTFLASPYSPIKIIGTNQFYTIRMRVLKLGIISSECLILGFRSVALLEC